MSPPHDSVLLLAFGGPTRPEEVRPFLDNVLRGRPIPRERYDEVVRHYEAVGGASPLNRLTFALAERLRDLLAREGPALPVHVGMRFWEPFIAGTLRRMAAEKLERSVGIVLAPHPSRASRDAYLEAAAEARARIGAAAPRIDFADPFYDHPLFIEAIVARLREALARIPEDRRRGVAVVFTAHSIPVAMSESSGYAPAFRRTAELAAEAAGLAAAGIASWSLAYQSRSGQAAERWLEPDIGEAIRSLGGRGVRDVLVAPIGFISDHVEVLYDLDVAARSVAQEIGVGFHRAATAGEHPAFSKMLLALVRERLGRPAA